MSTNFNILSSRAQLQTHTTLEPSSLSRQQNINIRAETFENRKTTVSTAQLCAVVAARRNCEICLAMDWNVLRRTLYLQQKHRQQQHLFVL